MNEPSDAELVGRYRAGEARALEQVVERYRRPLFKFILNMAANPDEANEVFQEVWFRAIKSLDRYRNDKLLSWLFRIAHNFMIDRFRGRKDLVSLDKTGAEGGSLGDVLANGDPSPAAQAGQTDLNRLVATAVAALPPEQKEVFVLRVEGEVSFKEIAAIQNVSINTALARMQYALSKLREALKAEAPLWREAR